MTTTPILTEEDLQMMPPNDSTAMLVTLFDCVCVPILATAEHLLTAEQAAAVSYAPLLLVSTDPVHVGLMGFGPSGPVDCGAYDLPPGAGAVLARFFEQGLSQLEPTSRAMVAHGLASGRAFLVASLRPDRGEATGTLVAHHDLAELVTLFRLQAAPAQVQ